MVLLLLALLVGPGALRVSIPSAEPSEALPPRSTLVRPQGPTAAQLRVALDTLRAGIPGDPGFDAALGQLPALLRSGSAWWVAGAAYVAGREGRTECVPALLEALERENARAANAADTAKRSLLDALLRLDARVPVEFAGRRLEPGSLAETFLLLVREPPSKERTAALLALFDAAPQGSRARWAAACALVEERAEQVDVRLVTGSDWTLRVCVSDAGEGNLRSGGGGGGAWSSSHAVWPPVVTYRLELPRANEPLLPIRPTRSEQVRSGTIVPELDDDGRDSLRARLLEERIGRPMSGPLPGSEILRIDWTDEDGYRRGLLVHFASLRARLGLLVEELGLAPERLDDVVIRVRVHDLRGKAAGPLPAGPSFPGVAYESE